MKLRHSKPNNKVYICGPMRGKPNSNFPAFDAAKKRAIEKGYDPISPADMDRLDDPVQKAKLTPEEFQEICAERDLKAIFEADNFAVLEGWEFSVGGRAEYFVAVWLSKNIMDAENFEPLGEVEITITKKEMQNV